MDKVKLFRNLIKPGYYQHYKNNLYYVYGVGLHTEQEEPVVFYSSCVDNSSDVDDGMYFQHIDLWCRPAKMFVETIKIDDVIIPRFKKID